MKSYLLLIILVSFSFCLFSTYATGHVAIIDKVKHDRNCFTQGLYYYNNKLYESCGLTHKSRIRILDELGNQLQSFKFSDEIFAEGIVVVNGLLFVLTWKNRKIFVLEANTLTPIGYQTFNSETNEGWGLAADMSSNSLILSDGSAVLSFYEIPSFDASANPNWSLDTHLGQWKLKRTVTVLNRSKQPLTYLNELELVEGYIYANVWYQSFIAKIDIRSGHVVEHFELAHLRPKHKQADVLNGIAYNESSKLFYITGKLWPNAYYVNLLDQPQREQQPHPDQEQDLRQ